MRPQFQVFKLVNLAVIVVLRFEILNDKKQVYKCILIGFLTLCLI